jgi:hypothetical protein
MAKFVPTLHETGRSLPLTRRRQDFQPAEFDAAGYFFCDLALHRVMKRLFPTYSSLSIKQGVVAMSLESLSELVEPGLTIVVAACWVIGMILKGTPKIPDWTIVYVVTLLAVILAMALQGWTLHNALEGLVCGAVAVYGHQLFKQTREAVVGGSKRSESGWRF